MYTTVYAQGPFEEKTEKLGLQLTTEQIGVIKQNQPFSFNIHVYNLSKLGSPVDNSTTQCYLHLSNSSGHQILELKGVYTQNIQLNNEWRFDLTGDNFTTAGDYAANIQCNNSLEAGVLSLGFEATYGGKVSSVPVMMGYGFALTLLVLMFYGCVVALVRLPQGNPKDEYGEILSINHLKYLKLPLIGLAYWLVVAISFMISTMARYYLSDALITNFFFAIFTWMMRLGIVLIFVLAGLILLEIFRDKELKNLMERGLPTR